MHCLTLVTAYQAFTDVVAKTDQALAFYQQLFSLIGALGKGVKHMEDASKHSKIITVEEFTAFRVCSSERS